MSDILQQVHPEPWKWMASMGVNANRVPTFTRGCEYFSTAGMCFKDIRHAIERSPRVLDMILDGNYAGALIGAREALSQPRRDAIDPETGRWVELPDDTPIVDAQGRVIGRLDVGITTPTVLSTDVPVQRIDSARPAKTPTPTELTVVLSVIGLFAILIWLVSAPDGSSLLRRILTLTAVAVIYMVIRATTQRT
jgi:hypothetical protein